MVAGRSSLLLLGLCAGAALGIKCWEGTLVYTESSDTFEFSAYIPFVSSKLGIELRT